MAFVRLVFWVVRLVPWHVRARRPRDVAAQRGSRAIQVRHTLFPSSNTDYINSLLYTGRLTGR